MAKQSRLSFYTLILLATSAGAQPPAAATASSPSAAAPPAGEPALEPRAIDLLKASSTRLAAARSMAFTAVVSYENPSRLGPPLVYTTRSDVTLQRPDKLQVITPGDGPASEFYYDGKTVVAFAPAENLAAVSEAPPTIDGMLEAGYQYAAIYFPFTDVMVADPFGDIAKGLELAFYIGQSRMIGGTTTYDNNAAALAAVLAEWSRTDIGYTVRMDHLTGKISGGLNGNYLLITQMGSANTVFGNGLADNLQGGAGMDWFFAGMADMISNQTTGEAVTPI